MSSTLKSRKTSKKSSSLKAKEKKDSAQSSSSFGKVVCTGVAVIFILYIAVNILTNPSSIGTPSQNVKKAGDKWSALSVDENEGHKHDPLDVLRARYNITVLHEDPVILQFDDFLTKAQCKHIIKLAKPHMARSTAGLGRETDYSRTSSTGWLMDPHHMKDEIVQDIQNRIAQVTNTPANNQEHFQVLHYKVGQFYKNHHDYIPEQGNFPAGARLATFFIYLSDVEEGGGTDFDRLNIRAMPKRGRAILWYNVQYNNETKQFTQDIRTHHEAMPPIKGVKWATNKWIHVNDFQTPFLSGDSA